MRMRICVFATAGLAGRCGALLLAAEPNRGRSHRLASVGRWSRVEHLRALGTNRGSWSGVSALGTVRLRSNGRWSRAGRFASQSRLDSFGQLGVVRERGLRTASSMEGAIFGLRIPGPDRRRSSQANFTRDCVCESAVTGRFIGSTVRADDLGAARLETSARDFGHVSRRARCVQPGVTQAGGFAGMVRHVPHASVGGTSSSQASSARTTSVGRTEEVGSASIAVASAARCDGADAVHAT
jgi:hypothetical protein